MAEESDNIGDSNDERGSRGARYTRLLTPRQAKLFGYIFSLVRNSDDAHDLLQLTLMALWNKFDDYEPGTNFTAWAMRVAQIEVLRYGQSKGRSKVMFDGDLVEKLAETRVAMDHRKSSMRRSDFLQECLGRLRPIDRELVEHRYEHGLSIGQLGDTLGRSSQSICNSLRRIRKILLACVERKAAERQ